MGRCKQLTSPEDCCDSILEDPFNTTKIDRQEIGFVETEGLHHITRLFISKKRSALGGTRELTPQASKECSSRKRRCLRCCIVGLYGFLVRAEGRPRSVWDKLYMLVLTDHEGLTENKVEIVGAGGSDQEFHADSMRVKFDVSISKGKTSVQTEIKSGNASHVMSQAIT